MTSSASLRLPRRHLFLAALLGAVAFVCLSAGSARAALLNVDPCDNATLTQPFAPWGDSNDYKLLPGGNFEGSLSGWNLTGGAAKVSGSEPYGATGSVGKDSINLPAGASITSPYTCVDLAYPTFRFFARNNGLLSTVLVSLVYKAPLLGPTTIPIGAVALSGTWQPTAPMLTLSVVEGLVNGLLTGKNPQIALKFTALTGDSQIDDVYVDPAKFR